MKLAWERHDVVRVTVRTTELAALVAAARLAHAALAAAPGERSDELGRVLADFDRAGQALQRRSPLEGPGSNAGSTPAQRGAR